MDDTTLSVQFSQQLNLIMEQSPPKYLHRINTDFSATNLFDISMNDEDSVRRRNIDEQFNRTMKINSEKNLVAILIGYVRKQCLDCERVNSSIIEFLQLFSSFIDSKVYSDLLLKYNRSKIEEVFQQIKFTVQQDSLHFYRFKINLYPSLIGSDSEDSDIVKESNFSQLKFDQALRPIADLYEKHLKQKLEIEMDLNELKQSMSKLNKLIIDCFEDKFQNQIKLILLEGLTEIEMLQEKLRLCQMQSLLDKDTCPDQLSTNYSLIVIENDQLTNRLNDLRRRKFKLDQLDRSKVERLRQLSKEVQFVEMLNQTPSITDESSILSRISLSFVD